MIGQANLHSRIEQLINDGTFPRFSILVGPKGSGKKTLAHEIAKKIPNALVFDVGLSVGDVRTSIENAYKMVNTVVRIIPDADTMSNAAKNALLKVTEEPPNNAYFIMTLEDENNTLETIRSRGTVFHMDSYTHDEIYRYACSFDCCDIESYKLFTSICDTPGDVDMLKKMGSKEFYNYVQLVVDNIAEVQLANAFKISEKIALKDGAEGYDLKLFWRAFYRLCGDRFFIGLEQKYSDPMAITNKYLQKLRIKGINRQMLFDSWLLEIREVWK